MDPLLELVLTLYGPSLASPPAGFAYLDRDLSVTYPRDTTDLPVPMLVELARHVLESGAEIHDIAIPGSPLVATCTPVGDGGVVCALHDPGLTAMARRVVMETETPIAIFGTDQQRRLANAAWQALVPGVTGVPVEMRPIIDGALESDKRVELADVVLGGRTRSVTARPFHNALGTFRGCLVSVEAARTPAERSALAEIELANRQKDQFIATISHELRAPLAAMLLWEKVLREESLDAPTRAKALDAIHESATSQSRLVGDLLDVSRAINGKLRIDKQQVGIHELLTGVIEAAKPAAAARGVTLGHQLTGSTPFVVGDINRLRQIFRNLVGNAIACTPAGGRVTIETHVRNAMLEVAIVDNGRGIAPALLPHLFEPFRQAVDAPEGGLGLGLAVASQLVTLHGGTIVAESPGLGHGATFRVTVPRAPDGQRPVETVAKAARLGGINVLVVDDDARVLEALRLLLERAGAVVSTARSADAGYRTAERVLPDLVLSDLAMPDGDGCSMMRKIRAHETTGRRVPAVAMTAHVADINRQDALSSGFDRYVTKPLDIDQLITTIARLVPVAARE